MNTETITRRSVGQPNFNTLDNGSWAVPWSDLMMVMFVLFVVLFATKAAEPDGISHQGQAMNWEWFGETEQLAGVEELGVTFSAEGERVTKIRFGELVFFQPGSVELNQASDRVLVSVGQLLSETEHHISVVGHTDDFPIDSSVFPSNWELSAARAAKLARHFIEVSGIDPRRITILGRSMYEPLSPNTSPENKARNRRVEILLEDPEAIAR